MYGIRTSNLRPSNSIMGVAQFDKPPVRERKQFQFCLLYLKGFLKDDEQQKPLIIYGASGSGKTSIVAMVVSQIKEWLGSEAVGVFRFLGTSPDSSGILSTLASVCTQLCEVFALTQPGDDILEDYSQVLYCH